MESLKKSKIELVYVMDPHCGWCYGFGTVILELFEKYKDNPSVSFDVRPGGLFSPKIEVPAGFADEKRPIAKRVEELSGVKFMEVYFSDILGEGSNLDSEPPARAILTIKELTPGILVPFTEKLLELEFIKGQNNSLDETILMAVEEFKIDKNSFAELYHSDAMKQKTLVEFREVATMTSGFPILYMVVENEPVKLAGGFTPVDRLIKKINTAIN